jgi:branched-chain amino acid transport system permease protein
MQFWFVQSLNGIAYGMLLFLLSSGLSLILGVMRVANLGHAAFYLLASYISYSVTKATGNFLLAILAGALAGLAAGFVTERFFMRHLLGRTLQQVLLSIGLAFVIGDLCLVLWQGDPVTLRAPGMLSGSVDLGIAPFPVYRVFIIVVGFAVAVGLWLMLERTRLGATIRAGVDNQEMAEAMGIDIERVFMLMFSFGAMLAGVAGALGTPFVSVYPGLDWELLPTALVVVIVGGIGSVNGALVGSIILGLLDNFGRTLFPEMSYFTLFVPMIIILAFRPAGILPRR